MKLLRIACVLFTILALALVTISIVFAQIGSDYEDKVETNYYDVPLSEAKITYDEARTLMKQRDYYYSMYEKLRFYKISAIIIDIVLLLINAFFKNRKTFETKNETGGV